VGKKGGYEFDHWIESPNGVSRAENIAQTSKNILLTTVKKKRKLEREGVRILESFPVPKNPKKENSYNFLGQKKKEVVRSKSVLTWIQGHRRLEAGPQASKI